MLETIASAFAPMFYLISPYDLALREDEQQPRYLDTYLPMFFVMMIIEAIATKFLTYRQSKVTSHTNYFTPDTFASVFLGTSQSIFMLLLKRLGVEISSSVYTYIWQNYRLVTYDVKEWPLATYFGLLLGVDCAYYWYHRVAHEFHALWAGHNVHHSGDTYNLATALRQGAIQPLTSSWLTHIPLAFIFPPAPHKAHHELNTLYMFWVHTELVGRLGPLEYVLNTPMAHRMHHRAPGNCNYAGVFIIWDRLFGTYEVELVRKDSYGLAAPATSFSILQLNLRHWHIMRNIPRSWLGRLFARRVKAKWFCRPSALLEPIPPQQGDQRPQGYAQAHAKEKLGRNVPLSFRLQMYIIVAGTVGILASFVMLLTGANMQLSRFLPLLAICFGHLEVMSKLFTNPSKNLHMSLSMFVLLLVAMPLHMSSAAT